MRAARSAGATDAMTAAHTMIAAALMRTSGSTGSTWNTCERIARPAGTARIRPSVTPIAAGRATTVIGWLGGQNDPAVEILLPAPRPLVPASGPVTDSAFLARDLWS